MLGDFNAKLGKETIFITTIGNHSLHNVSSGNEFKFIDFTSGKKLTIKSIMFPHKDV